MVPTLRFRTVPWHGFDRRSRRRSSGSRSTAGSRRCSTSSFSAPASVSLPLPRSIRSSSSFPRMPRAPTRIASPPILSLSRASTSSRWPMSASARVSSGVRSRCRPSHRPLIDRSLFLIVHGASVLVLTLIVLAGTYRHYVAYAKLRHAYLTQGSVFNRSVLVRDASFKRTKTKRKNRS